MKMNEKLFGSGVLTFALLGLLSGLLLIVLPVELLLKIVFVIVGIVTVVSNLPGLIVGLSNIGDRVGQVSLVLSLISVILGVLMIFFHSSVLMILVGVYLLILPLVEILLSKNRGAQLRAELPKLILGVVLLVVGPARTVAVLFDVAGWIIVTLTVIYLVAMLISYLHRQQKADTQTGNRTFVDTTGDGKIDTVYVDTDGDGTPDTKRRYRENK